MKKKLILACSITYCISLGVMLGLAAVGIWYICYVFIERNFSPLYIVGLISAMVIAIVALICAVKTIIKTRIELQADKIFVPKGAGKKGENLVQYEKTIPYSEIAKIGYSYTVSDSEGGSPFSLLRPLFYLVFFDDEGNSKAINTDYYTKKQMAQMIDEIVLRCKNFGRDIPIESGKKFLAECIEEIQRKEKSGRKKK